MVVPLSGKNYPKSTTETQKYEIYKDRVLVIIFLSVDPPLIGDPEH